MPEPDREAYEAAERLVREAAGRAERAARAAADGIPAGGWSSGDRAERSPFPDVTALLVLVDAFRGSVPPELARQLADALRELLLAIRAVLDYSIAALERPPADERDIEDIPIQ